MLSPFPFHKIDTWYKKSGRKWLPWRDYQYDEKQLWYRVWLAETMLQQTQVNRVKLYFENILKAFPTIGDLATTSYEDFFPYYKWLGYYSRARNMLKAAQSVTHNFEWIFPKSSDELKTLAGIGPYTAEAIRAFAYDISTLSFDTNLEKIFSRYYFGNKYQKLSKKEKEIILSDFKKSWISWRDMNNALMDFWAIVSLNSVNQIDWDNYPLQSSKFYQTRWTLEPLKTKKSSNFPNKQAHVFVILHENHKRYFSEDEKFSPFYIWKNIGDPRSMIQDYFIKKLHLELSVRPPEVKSYKHEIPYLVCYAQIQSGKHSFKIFEWLKIRGSEESLIENIDF